MVKIICLTLGCLHSNRYIGPSGKEYMFHRSGATDVDVREDAESFLKSNNGKAFKKVTKAGEFIEDIKEALAQVAKELPGKKKEEEKPVAEEKPKVVDEKKPEPKPEEKPVEKPKKKIYNYDELKAMNKKAQINYIEELGGNKFPAFESGRIKYILELQKKL